MQENQKHIVESKKIYPLASHQLIPKNNTSEESVTLHRGWKKLKTSHQNSDYMSKDNKNPIVKLIYASQKILITPNLDPQNKLI